MKIMSPAFNDNELIPAEYTCDDRNINPPLDFSDIPERTESMVLIVDDPDAPGGVFTHWVIWGMDPVDAKGISQDSVPNPGNQGKNSAGNNEYMGPCPPAGEVHRYRFKLYALGTVLSLDQNTTQQDLEEEMSGHIIEDAQLVGRYGREV